MGVPPPPGENYPICDAVADPDLQIRGGGGSGLPDSEISGEGEASLQNLV